MYDEFSHDVADKLETFCRNAFNEEKEWAATCIAPWTMNLKR